MTRRRGIAVAGLALASLSAAGLEASGAAFSDRTSNPGTRFTAAPDFEAPSASAATIAMTSGGPPGFIRGGGVSYRVYANPVDSGNPPSGLDDVSANVSSFDSGQTNVALGTGGCPCTIGGVTYSHRSSSLTANNSISDGAKSWTLTLDDNAGNSRTQAFSVTADGSRPFASDIQTTSAGQPGRPTAGDTVVYTFTEPIVPGTVLSGWNGSATAVRVFIANSSFGGDDLSILPGSGGGTLPLGTVDLDENGYVSSNSTWSATMSMSGSQIVVTLGTQTGGNSGTEGNSGTMTWSPSTTPTDAAGNNVDNDSASESGGNDREF
jgi:hypothetical protein